MLNWTTTSKSIASTKVYVAAGASAFVCACSTPVTKPSGFLSDHKTLSPSAFENVSLYRAPGFDPQMYGQVQMTPTQVHGPSTRLRELDPGLQKEILIHTDKEMASRLLIGVRSGTKTLMVRAAVTDVDTPNRAVNVATTLLLGPVTSGGASMEVEVVDGQSGVVQVAAACTERGSVLRQFTGAYSVLAHAKHAISECIQRFEQAYRTQPSDIPASVPRATPTIHQDSK
jgi:Protein of unknown function (DUF3313)